MTKKELTKWYGTKAQKAVLAEMQFNPDTTHLNALLSMGNSDYFIMRAREAMAADNPSISEVQRYLLLAKLARIKEQEA